MINSHIIEIENINSYDKLFDLIPHSHIDLKTVNEIKDNIGTNADYIITENPYADRDFLSTYYIFYSMKFRNYEKSCFRIHFFRRNAFGEPDIYGGFITLRPTISGTRIGRSYLEPVLLSDPNSFIMSGKYKVNLLGNEIFVNAFPWMHQETDVSICAHVAVWSVLRYFGNKYRYYPDWTMGEIVSKITSSTGRKIPSTGLSAPQICEVLQSAGFSPIIREKTNNDFLFEIMSYIESGIPVIGMASNITHAFSIIGHGMIDTSFLSCQLDDYFVQYSYDNRIIISDIIPSYHCITSLVINDDNTFPYRTVPLHIGDMPGTSAKYCADNIDVAIIPLYNKMQIVFNEIYNRFIILSESQRHGKQSKSSMKWPSPKVARLFITSSNSFKEKTLLNESINPEIKNIILNMNFPKFIWCIEIYRPENYSSGLVSGMILVDTTACSKDQDPWLFMHDCRKAKWVNEKGKTNIYFTKSPIEPFNRYINNLNEVSNLWQN